jgi:hypothetical protein
MMWALCVIRSTTALASRGSANTFVPVFEWAQPAAGDGSR